MSRRITISPCPYCNEVERLFVEDLAAYKLAARTSCLAALNDAGTCAYQVVCWECQARGGLAPSKRATMKVWNGVAEVSRDRTEKR